MKREEQKTLLILQMIYWVEWTIANLDMAQKGKFKKETKSQLKSSTK